MSNFEFVSPNRLLSWTLVSSWSNLFSFNFIINFQLKFSFKLLNFLFSAQALHQYRKGMDSLENSLIGKFYRLYSPNYWNPVCLHACGLTCMYLCMSTFCVFSVILLSKETGSLIEFRSHWFSQISLVSDPQYCDYRCTLLCLAFYEAFYEGIEHFLDWAIFLAISSFILHG